MSTEQNTKLTRIGDGSRKYYSVYRCGLCGGTKEIYDYSVRRGLSKSCGCLVAVTNARVHKGNKWKQKHGGFGTHEYDVWLGMRSRCENPSSTGYENYGGRGIKVCDRWQNVRGPDAVFNGLGNRTRNSLPDTEEST